MAMIQQNAFNKLIDEIVSKGYDEATAGEFAILIGDTPIVDESGAVVVMDGDKELARLKLTFFSTKH